MVKGVLICYNALQSILLPKGLFNFKRYFSLNKSNLNIFKVLLELAGTGHM